MKLHEIAKEEYDTTSPQYRQVVEWYKRNVGDLDEGLGEVLRFKDGILYQTGTLEIDDKLQGSKLEIPPCKVDVNWVRIYDADFNGANFDWIANTTGITISYTHMVPTIGTGWDAIFEFAKRFPNAMISIKADINDPPAHGITEFALSHKRFGIMAYDGEVQHGKEVIDLGYGYVEFRHTQDLEYNDEFELQELLIQHDLESWT